MAQCEAESSSSAPPTFECHELAVTVDHSRRILEGVDLCIDEGEFVSIIGGSGVGKTTLMRVLGGLHPADVKISAMCNGRPIDGVPEGVVVVFQDYGSSLLPWRTVSRNVELALEGRRVDRNDRMAAVEDALSMVGLREWASNYPSQLSGGMQQRLQIARALVMEPLALLMDEPFGALDAMTKNELQDALLLIHAETSLTVVFVTHDIEEAVYMSDRIILLSGRPAAVEEDLRIELDRPRDQIKTKEEPRYLELRHHVYQLLHRGHGNDH